MRKHIITILFCMLAMVAAAQEYPTDNQSDGWTVPPIKIKTENTKQGKDSAKGKRKKKKDIPSFSRDRDAPLPEWRRPTAEECDTEKGKKKKGSIIYYTSMENFKTGKSEILTDVEMKDHSDHHSALYGGNDFKFKSGNDDADDILKKTALIVIMDDSLYVNCRKVRTSEAKFPRGYAHGYRYDSDKICFINEKIDDKKNVNSSAFFSPICLVCLEQLPQVSSIKTISATRCATFSTTTADLSALRRKATLSTSCRNRAAAT